MSKKILGWGIVNALGTLTYIAIVVGILGNAESAFGNAGKIVAPMIFLLLFVVSASVTAALVLGRPIWWYLAGEKSEAVKLFVATVSWLVLFLVVIILGQIGYEKWFAHPKIWTNEPRFCTEEAKICPNGSAVGRTGPNCEFAPCP